MIDLIIDKGIFNRFIDKVLCDLENDEVYFLCLFARNKYLTKDERQEFCLNKSQMVEDTIVRSKDDFEYAMRKLAATLMYKTTRNGKPIPFESLTAYVSVNPASMLRACSMFAQEVPKLQYEILSTMLNGSQANWSHIKRLDKKLINYVKQTRSRRCYIDIDIDGDSKVLDRVCYDLLGLTCHTITTKSGWHVLLDPKKVANSDIRLDLIVSQADEIAKLRQGEVIFNKNEMVPVPGTKHAGKLVLSHSSYKKEF